jgi:hypothetical protein
MEAAVRSLRRSGGLLAIDNALSHGDQPAALDAPIEAESSLSRALVPIGAGLALAVRGRPPLLRVGCT